MSDLIIVKVKDGINIDSDMMRYWRNKIIEQKETGVILLPWFLTASVVPEDIEIKMESEDIESKYEQQPCGDAIDRRLVYAFIDGLISDDGERKKGLEYIRSLPSVPTKTEQWIPVKESLPKTAREVRVTDGTDIFIGWYDGTEWCSSSELFWPDTHPITAWMPYHIPKPYKEEKD